MAVLGAVGVTVLVLVLDVVMLVRGVRVCVTHVAVLMLVRVGLIVVVLFGHRCLLGSITWCRYAAGPAVALIR